MTKLLTRTGLSALVAIVSAVIITQWITNRKLESDNAEIRTQLLDRVAADVGGRTASVVKAKRVEKAAVEAVGEAIVASITSVADVESVATASEEVASTAAGEYQVTDELIFIKERHGRVSVSVPNNSSDADIGEVEFILKQHFEYALVRFKNNGDAVLLNVKERSPLTHEILRESMVVPDKFLVAKHRKKLRDRFGWSASCGIGYTGAGEMDVTCGVGYGFRF